MDAPGTAILYSWGRTGFEHMYCKHVLFPLSCKHTLFLHLSGLFLGRFQPVYYSILIIAIPEFLLTQTFMIFCYHIFL
jgi:hypothetical protein